MFKLKHIFQDEGMWWGDSSGNSGQPKKTTGHKQTFWTKGKPRFRSYRETIKQLVQKNNQIKRQNRNVKKGSLKCST